MTNLFRFFLLMALLSGAANLGAAPAEEAQSLAEQLVASYNGEAPEDFAQHIPFPDAAKLLREGFVQGVRQWTLRLLSIDGDDERAVAALVVWSLPRERPVDTLFFYAERQQDAWQWTAMNEDKAFRALFLLGTIDGDFRLEDLPANDELTRLGRRLSPGLGALASGEPRFTSLWHEATGRGALVITSTEPADDPASAVLYLRRTPEGWVLTGSGYRLGLATFFEDFPARQP